MSYFRVRSAFLRLLFYCFSSPIGNNVVISFRSNGHVSILLRGRGKVFISSTSVVTYLSPTRVTIFYRQYVFTGRFVASFSARNGASVALAIHNFPRVLPIFIYPKRPLFMDLFRDRGLASNLFYNGFFARASLTNREASRVSAKGQGRYFSQFSYFCRAFFVCYYSLQVK